jgi:hypothetical protein
LLFHFASLLITQNPHLWRVGTQFLKLSVFVAFESRKGRNQSQAFVPQPDASEAYRH